MQDDDDVEDDDAEEDEYEHEDDPAEDEVEGGKVEDDDVEKEEEDDVEDDNVEVDDEKDDNVAEDEVEDEDVEDDDVKARKMMTLRMMRLRRRKRMMLRAKTEPKTGDHTLCEPAQSKCTSTYHKSQAREFPGKTLGPKTGTQTLRGRNRNAQEHDRRATLCETFQKKCCRRERRRLCASCAGETHMVMDISKETLFWRELETKTPHLFSVATLFEEFKKTLKLENTRTHACRKHCQKVFREKPAPHLWKIISLLLHPLARSPDSSVSPRIHFNHKTLSLFTYSLLGT